MLKLLIHPAVDGNSQTSDRVDIYTARIRVKSKRTKHNDDADS